MNVITNKITLDLKKPELQPIVHAVQGEYNTRCVEIALLEDGIPWNIPEDVLFAVRYGRITSSGGYYDTLPDGTPACSFRDNTIQILLAPQMMAEAGSVFAQVEILCQSQVLVTFSFLLMVAVNPALGATQAENYFNLLQWMKQQLGAYIEALVETDAFIGPAGPQGVPAAITEQKVEYQVSKSGTAVPSGDWTADIPTVTQGKYLWTRTTVIFNTGSPLVSYSVSRMGLDGSGSVSSVADVSPDPNGNVPLNAEDIGALPNTGGDLTGELKMNGQPISGLNAPAANDQAANMGFVNQQMKKAAPRNLLDNSDFTQFIAQAGIGGNHGTQAYAGDRWILDSGTVTGEANENGNGYFNITLNGTIRQVVSNPSDTGIATIEMVSGTAVISYAGGEVSISSSGGVIKNAALYEGEYTSETLPKYKTKGYGTELAECQRYYRKMSSSDYALGYSVLGDNRIMIPLAISDMRKSPTTSGSVDAFSTTGWQGAQEPMYTGRVATGYITFLPIKDGFTFNAGSCFIVRGTIELSADL